MCVYGDMGLCGCVVVSVEECEFCEFLLKLVFGKLYCYVNIFIGSVNWWYVFIYLMS